MSDNSPYDQMTRRWKWTESCEDGIQIVTESGSPSFRIFRMYHSGFGVSTTDREIADHVCNLHNASLG